MNSIGCRICNLRKQNGMSQEQLAEKLNVSRQSVSKWERDEALPDIFNLEAISEIFSVSIDYLVKDEQSTADGTLTAKQVNEREKLIKKANTLLIIAIAIYILDVFVMGGLWFILPFAEAYKIVIFGVVAAIATGIIIYQGFIRNEIIRLYSKNSEQAIQAESNRYYRPSCSFIYTAALIIYLGLGFTFGLWREAWGIFPVAVLTSMLLNRIKFPRRQAKLSEKTESKNLDS